MATHYGTLSEANDYFNTRLHSDLWEGTDPAERTKALYSATRAIDRLDFAGEKAAAYTYRQGLTNPNQPSATELLAIQAAGITQTLEFPRGADSTVPEDIEIACYELAYALLDGKDPQFELENLAMISQGYSAVRNTADRGYAQEHLLAGIPSTSAWSYLKPYLRENKEIRVVRL